MNPLELANQALAAARCLPGKGGRRAIGYDLASLGEWQFIRPVLLRHARTRPADLILLFHREVPTRQLEALFPEELRGRILPVSFRVLHWSVFRRLDLYITSEQFVPGPGTVYTLTLFHGQPSKGLTFRLPGYDPLVANDALFLYGPLQRRALDEHLADSGRELPPHLRLFEIGYAKSDDLLSGRFDRKQILLQLGLDPTRPTILYAPAFNEGASMREYGVQILATLCSNPDHNVLAKLPIDCTRPTTDLAATGGIDWFEVIGRLERDHRNFRLVRGLEVDPFLASADVLVTCISSVSFEFLALGRPVVFIDTPRYYEHMLPRLFPGKNLGELMNRATINGGREFGVVVSSPRELSTAVEEILAHPEAYPRRRSELPGCLLYNPGRAAEVGVAEIGRILDSGVRSTRPGDQGDRILRELTVLGSLGPRLWRAAKKKARSVAVRLSGGLGFAGLGFIDARSTVKAAQRRGLSVCDYLESQEDDASKKGRRDAIIKAMEGAGVFRGVRSVCEVGAGTGRYLEKVVVSARPQSYEVYETNRGWIRHLRSTYGSLPDSSLVCHDADGRTLRPTPSGSCNLVHAHGVFVYLPVLQTLEYLEEAVRVCRQGGHIVFDYCPDTSLTWRAAQAWLAGPHRFLVSLPASLLEDFSRGHDLQLVSRFPVVYGAGAVEYLIWRKGRSRWAEEVQQPARVERVAAAAPSPQGSPRSEHLPGRTDL